ncbi:translation initiation factor IF-2-like [Falco biarmicus]|uniref:translation initiation factor IF-2-like n=1 Tax=Falco biarmicus TaxID=345155 RepID=UPI0024BC540F|nr:translation initiation factor IF-2-like [Falco biarmicus]
MGKNPKRFYLALPFRLAGHGPVLAPGSRAALPAAAAAESGAEAQACPSPQGHPLEALTVGQPAPARPPSCAGHTPRQPTAAAARRGQRAPGHQGNAVASRARASSPRGPPRASGGGRGPPPAPCAITVLRGGPARACPGRSGAEARLLSATPTAPGRPPATGQHRRQDGRRRVGHYEAEGRRGGEGSGGERSAPTAGPGARRMRSRCRRCGRGAGRGGHGAAPAAGAAAAGGGGAAGRPPALPRHGAQPRFQIHNAEEVSINSGSVLQIQ